jgi:hypothetical protein
MLVYSLSYHLTRLIARESFIVDRLLKSRYFPGKNEFLSASPRFSDWVVSE